MTIKSNSVAPPDEYVGNLWLLAATRCHVNIANARRHAHIHNVMYKNVTSSTKPEVNIALSSEEVRATVTDKMYRKFRTAWTCGFEICQRTDRHTNRHEDRNTSHPYRGQSNKNWLNDWHIDWLIRLPISVRCSYVHYCIFSENRLDISIVKTLSIGLLPRVGLLVTLFTVMSLQ